MKHISYYKIKDAIKYAHQDMDGLTREILRTEGIRKNGYAYNFMDAE
jgi:hypothetical protein